MQPTKGMAQMSALRSVKDPVHLLYPHLILELDCLLLPICEVLDRTRGGSG